MTPPSTPTPSPTPNDPATTPDPAKTTVPDAYTYTPKDGEAFDKTVLDAATPIFKELNLTQPQADKLIEFWNSQAKTQADLHVQTVLAQREKWVGEVKADPDLGPKLAQVTADIGRAFDALGDAKLVDGFKEAMNLTGVGDNPAFIKAFWKLAQKVNEGKPVSGGGPSPNGQTPSGQTRRPSAAEAMYPQLQR